MATSTSCWSWPARHRPEVVAIADPRAAGGVAGAAARRGPGGAAGGGSGRSGRGRGHAGHRLRHGGDRRRGRPCADPGGGPPQQSVDAGQQGGDRHGRPAVHPDLPPVASGFAADRQRTQCLVPVPAAAPRARPDSRRAGGAAPDPHRVGWPLQDHAGGRRWMRSRRTRPVPIRSGRWDARSRSTRRR